VACAVGHPSVSEGGRRYCARDERIVRDQRSRIPCERRRSRCETSCCAPVSSNRLGRAWRFPGATIAGHFFHRTHYRASCSANTAIPRIIRTRIQRNGPSGSDYPPWIRFESGHLCKSPFHRKPCPIQFVTLGDGSRRITRRSSPGSTPALTRSPTPGDTSRTTDSHAVADGLRRLLEETGILEACLGSRRRGRGYWLRPPGESRGGTALRRRDELRPRPPSDDRSRAARDPDSTRSRWFAIPIRTARRPIVDWTGRNSRSRSSDRVVGRPNPSTT